MWKKFRIGIDYSFLLSRLQAAHAQETGADSLLCLPELFNKPSSVDEVVDYLRLVAAAAPNTPLLYYHNPAYTSVSSEYSPTRARQSRRRLNDVERTFIDVRTGESRWRQGTSF